MIQCHWKCADLSLSVCNPSTGARASPSTCLPTRIAWKRGSPWSSCHCPQLGCCWSMDLPGESGSEGSRSTTSLSLPYGSSVALGTWQVLNSPQSPALKRSFQGQYYPFAPGTYCLQLDASSYRWIGWGYPGFVSCPGMEAWQKTNWDWSWTRNWSVT